jgi:hypothetical protein
VTRTRTWPVVVGLLGLGAVALWLGSAFLGDRSAAEPAASDSPRLRPIRSHRVPKLRVAAAPAPAHGFPAAPPATPPQLVTARSRLAPLLSHYRTFLEETQLDASSQREVRRLLHRAHESVLLTEQLAAQNLAERGSPKGTRERALRELEGELANEVRPEEAERVLAHPFVQELLAWNEPLFEANPRGVVNVRADLDP